MGVEKHVKLLPKKIHNIKCRRVFSSSEESTWFIFCKHFRHFVALRLVRAFLRWRHASLTFNNHLLFGSILASVSTSMPTNASPLANKRPPDEGVSFGQSPKRKLVELMFVPKKNQSEDLRDALLRYYAQPRTHCWPAHTSSRSSRGRFIPSIGVSVHRRIFVDLHL